MNQEYYTIQQLAEYLQIGVGVLMKEINRYLEVVKRSIGKGMETGIANSTFFQAQMGVWEAIHKSREQLSILALSQNGTYQAFLSKEVNSAVNNFNNSMKLAIEMAKLSQPTQPTVNVLNQNGIVQAGAAFIGPDEALKLAESSIAKQATLKLGSPAYIDFLEVQNNLTDPSIPNIQSDAQSESSVMAKAMRKRGASVDEEEDKALERKFRDFKVLDEDNDDEVILPRTEEHGHVEWNKLTLDK